MLPVARISTTRTGTDTPPVVNRRRKTIRKAIASALAAAMMFSAAAPAMADVSEVFYFRYKNPVSWNLSPNPGEEGQYADGNDISVYFTGVIGEQFAKTIPVKTTEVVDWRVSSGVVQPGLAMNARTGSIAGVATGKYKPYEAQLLGYDARGTNIARAKIKFAFHDPAGNATDFKYCTHIDRTFYQPIKTTVPVASWVPLTDLPAGFKVEGSYLSGRPTAEFDTGVALVGYNAAGQEVAFVHGELSAKAGPVIATIPDMIQHPSKNFMTTAKVSCTTPNVFPRWRLAEVGGSGNGFRIGGMTGIVNGRIATFDTTRKFRAEFLDADGTIGKSNVFSVSTSSPDTDIAALKDLFGVVNKPYTLSLTAKDLSGELNWDVIEGSLPAGITLDSDTGELSGTPTTVQTQSGIVVSVKTSDGGYDQSAPFSFTVAPEEIEVAFTPIDVRTGTSFQSAGPTFVSGIVNPYSFTEAAGVDIDEAIEVDYDSAKVSGKIDIAGQYDVPFKFVNGDGNSRVFSQAVTVHDPISIAYEEVNTVYRRTAANVAPSAVVGAIGNPVYKLKSGTLPPGLTFSETTGTFSGTPEIVEAYPDFVVGITDTSGASVDSEAFAINVADRPDVIVITSDIEVERFVDNQVQAAAASNVFDGVSYELVEGVLPEGLFVDDKGFVVGTTSDPMGVYPGIRIQATDGEGYSTVSDAFSITVVPPKDLKPLLADGSNVVNASWTAGVPFRFELPTSKNAFGGITYTFSQLPAGTAVTADGYLDGVIGQVGVYNWPMTLTDAAGRSLSGSFVLTITEPMTAILGGTGKRFSQNSDEVFFDVPRGGATSIAPVLTNAIHPVTYAFSGQLPDGLLYSSGAITGAGVIEGQNFPFSITVTDAAGTSIPLSATVTVGQRLPLNIAYNIPEPAGLAGAVITPIIPVVQDAIGAVSYKLTGTLPDGLFFDENTGVIFGTPSQDGLSGDLVVRGTDSDLLSPSSSQYGPFKVGIALAGVPNLAGTTFFTVRSGKSFSETIPVGNVTDPVVFAATSGSLSNGLALDADTGAISGSLSPEGKYPVGQVSVTDAMGRTKSTGVTITAVGPLSLAAPAVTEFPQYSAASASVVTINAVGKASYELLSGNIPPGMTFNATNGKFVGTPTVMGNFGGLVVRVTDTTGDSASVGPFALTVGDRLPLTLEVESHYDLLAAKGWHWTLPVKNAVNGKSFVQTGTLPRGVTFDDVNGVFKGYINQLGRFDITVTVTDGVGASETKTFSLTTRVEGEIGLTPFDFTTKAGFAVATVRPATSNVLGAPRFWADPELAAAGLAIDPDTGVISGDATAAQVLTPNIHITDETNRVTSKTIRITILPALTINVAPRIEMLVQRSLYPWATTKFSASNAIGPLEWDYEGTLPKGVNFSKSMRLFSGTPTEMGTFNVTIKVRETKDFMQAATANVELVVINNGLPPTVSLTPSSSGYYIGALATLTPQYKNAKKGDILSLAPDSDPLPPGMTITRNASGVPVLQKAGVAASASGVYRNIKLRISDTEGLYSDSAPFTIVYKSDYQLKSYTVDARIGRPMTLAAVVPTGGSFSVTPVWSLGSDFTQGGLSVDPVSGILTGTIPKAGSISVYSSEIVDGKLIRKASYTVTFRVIPMSLTVPPIVGAFQKTAFPSSYAPYAISVTNGTPEGRYSTAGNFPAGLSIDPVSGKITGSPTTSGVYDFRVVFADEYESVEKPVKAYIEKTVAAGSGYRFIRLTVDTGAPHLDKFIVRGSSGYDMMHAIADGASTFSQQTQSVLRTNAHIMDIRAGQYHTFNLPAPVAEGKVTFSAHTNGVFSISGSTDGALWTKLGSRTVISTTEAFEIPFVYVPPQPTDVDIQVVNSASSEILTIYGVPPSLVTTARIAGTSTPHRVTWTRLSGSIPPGMTAIPSADGTQIVYGGYPTTTGTYGNIVWRATDSNGNTATSTAVSFQIKSGTAMSLTRSTTNNSFYAGRQSASATVTVKNVPYGKTVNDVDWAVVGNIPDGVSWTVANGILKFAGTSYLPGTYSLRVEATERVRNTKVTTDITLTVQGVAWWIVHSTRDSSNAANISCPVHCNYERVERLQLGVTTPTLSAWMNQNSTGQTIVTATLKAGSSLPPGVSIAIDPGATGYGFSGKPTATGTFTAIVLIKDKSGTILQMQPVTFVVVP